MDACIRHHGWNNWGKMENERSACFYEYRCYGPGSCPSKRVTWARELVDEEAEQFLMHGFIDPNPERPWLAQRMALRIPYTVDLIEFYNIRDTIIEIFYEKHLCQLIDVITSSYSQSGPTHKSVGSRSLENQTRVKPEILLNICDLLCFCVLYHPYRIKRNFLLNNVIDKVLFMTRRTEKYLVVAAVWFVRTVISCKLVASGLQVWEQFDYFLRPEKVFLERRI